MIKLTERQIKEMIFALIYAEQFGHGTEGHNRLLLIAKLAQALGLTEQRGRLYQDGIEVQPVQEV